MKSTEKQELKRKIKLIGLFMLIVFLPIATVSTLMAVAQVKMGWNIAVNVILLFVLYGFYAWIWDKLDKRKKERMSKKKDPFSD